MEALQVIYPGFKLRALKAVENADSITFAVRIDRHAEVVITAKGTAEKEFFGKSGAVV